MILDLLWQSAVILPEGKTVTAPEKAYVRIRPSNVADSASSEYDYLRIFYGNTSDMVKITVKAEII